MKLSVVRVSALAGVVLAITIVGALLLPTAPPGTNDSVLKISNWFGAFRHRHLVAGYIGFVDLFLAAWWLVGVYWLLRRNSRPSLLPGVAILGGIFGAIMSTIGPLVQVGITHTAGLYKDYPLDRFAYDTMTASGLLGLIPFAAMASATAWQGTREKNLPSWLIWGSWLLTIAAFVAGVSAISVNEAWMPAAYVGFGLSVLWILGTSALMWMWGEDADALLPAQTYEASTPGS